MAALTAKINFKNMDFFKFKKIVIDGNRDDYESCSREIKSMCDAVQTLAFRDEQFGDDGVEDGVRSSDSRHFDEILSGYRQILAGKRVEPVDIRVKTGWWADASAAASTCGSAGKFKSSALRDTLLAKFTDWCSRHGLTTGQRSADDLDRPGVYVFKHRERQCFQSVGLADRGVFATCSELLKATFEGNLNEPLAALLVVSMAADWDFYFVPVSAEDGTQMLRILYNDLVLRHDSIWPRGLNRLLLIETPLDVTELRLSCLRHHWPPSDIETPPLDRVELGLERIRKRIQMTAAAAAAATPLTVAPTMPHAKSPSPAPVDSPKVADVTAAAKKPRQRETDGGGSSTSAARTSKMKQPATTPNGSTAVSQLPAISPTPPRRTAAPVASKATVAKPTVGGRKPPPPHQQQQTATPRDERASTTATTKTRPSSAPRPHPGPPHPKPSAGVAQGRPKSASSGTDDRRRSANQADASASAPTVAGNDRTSGPHRSSLPAPKSKLATPTPTKNGVKQSADKQAATRQRQAPGVDKVNGEEDNVEQVAAAAVVDVAAAAAAAATGNDAYEEIHEISISTT